MCKLGVSKLGVSKLGVREAAGGGGRRQEAAGGGGRGREEKEAGGSAQPKPRTPHKDAGNNGIPQAAAAARNRDAPLRSADAELQSTIELRATARQFAAPKADLDAQAEKPRC